MSDRIHYIVPEQHAVRDVFQKFTESRASAMAAWQEFGNKHVALAEEGIWSSDGRFSGLAFPDNTSPNDCWKLEEKVYGQPHRFVPKGRTKAVRKLRDEIKALPRGMTRFEFDKHFEGPYINGLRWMSTGLEEFDTANGLVMVISVPARANMPTICEGLTEIKTSEYYALKEEHNARHMAGQP